MTKAVKCDNCPVCKKEMDCIYNEFFSAPWFGSYPEIRGQVCDNKECPQYAIRRRHPRQYQMMTKEEYKIFKDRVKQ